MRTPIGVWLAVAAIGGRLGVAGDKLRMLLPPNCPPGLKDAIRLHKTGLLELLHMDFLVVEFEALRTIVF